MSREQIRCDSCGRVTTGVRRRPGLPMRRVGIFVFLDPPTDNDGKTNNIPLHLCNACTPPQLVRLAQHKRVTMKAERNKQRERFGLRKSNHLRHEFNKSDPQPEEGPPDNVRMMPNGREG